MYFYITTMPISSRDRFNKLVWVFIVKKKCFTFYRYLNKSNARLSAIFNKSWFIFFLLMENFFLVKLQNLIWSLFLISLKFLTPAWKNYASYPWKKKFKEIKVINRECFRLQSENYDYFVISIQNWFKKRYFVIQSV